VSKKGRGILYFGLYRDLIIEEIKRGIKSHRSVEEFSGESFCM